MGTYHCFTYHCLLKESMGSVWKRIQLFLKNKMTSDPTIPFLGLYPKELKTGTPTDIYTGMFTKGFTMAEK